MEITFVGKIKKDKQIRILSERLTMPRFPVIGESMMLVNAKGVTQKIYRIVDVSTYLWPSGDNLVIEGSSKGSRPYGELILVEENLDVKVSRGDGDVEQK